MSQNGLFTSYVIDTCAILDFWGVEPFKIRPYHVKVRSFRTMWDHISHEIEEGRILVHKSVGDEIQSYDPELIDWLNTHKKYFVSDGCQEQLSLIVNEFEIYTKEQGSLTDAIVIATAMARGITVITSENHTDNIKLSAPKIPNVCDRFDIKWLHLPEYFVEQGL